MQIRWKSKESLKTSIALLVRLFFHILLETTINISMIFRKRIGYSFLRSRFKDRRPSSPVEKRTTRRRFLRYFIRRRRYPQAALLRPTCTVINLKRTGNEDGVKSQFQREFERR